MGSKEEWQEAEYTFPYHYLDLVSEEESCIHGIEYLNLLEVVKNLIKPYENQVILDVGCGDGRLSYELRKEKVKVVGVDSSRRAINFARAFNPDATFFVEDVKQFHMPHKFDYVILKETLEHFISREIPTILRNLSDVLKPDGKLIITVPSTNKPLPKKHYQHFSKESLGTTLRPWFEISRLFGYSQAGYKRDIFINLRRAGIVLYPLRNKTRKVKRFLSFLNNYYRQNLAIGDPNSCLGLVAVCMTPPRKRR